MSHECTILALPALELEGTTQTVAVAAVLERGNAVALVPDRPWSIG